MSERVLRSASKKQPQKVTKPGRESEKKDQKKKLKEIVKTKMSKPELTLSDITLEDQSGKSYNVGNDIINAGKPTLIFAYPKAGTSGCSKQAQGFRDFYKKLTEDEKVPKEKFQIFGLSNDTVKAQLKFKEEHGFQFSLLSDPERKLISFLKADKNQKSGTKRSHWVWDKNGDLKYEHVDVSPTVSLEKGIEEMEGLIKEK